MPSGNLSLVLLGCLCLFKLGSVWVEKVRCTYCGVIAGHDTHCPHNILNQE